MPNTKKPALGGTKPLLPGLKKPGFKPNQSRLPKGLDQGRRSKGDKPKLFPGRTGAR